MYVPYKLVPSHQKENTSVVDAVVDNTGATAAGHLNTEPHVVMVLEPVASCFIINI